MEGLAADDLPAYEHPQAQLESPRSRRNRLARERRARQCALNTTEQRQERQQAQASARLACQVHVDRRERDRQRVACHREARTREERLEDLEINREAHAGRRAAQSAGDAAAVRERDREAHAAHRAELQEEDAAAVRERDRLAHQQARAALPEIPVARRVIPANGTTLRHVLNRAEVRCRDCRALHWIEERLRGPSSTLGNPLFTMCCDRSRVANIPPLAQPPQPLSSLLRDQTPVAEAFRTNIRAYNSALSFTSLGAKFDERFMQGGVYAFRLQGALYHQMGALLPEPGQPRKFSQLYITDNNKALAGRMNVFPHLDQRIMGELQTMLKHHNPYVQMYEQVRQRMEDDRTVDLELRLLCLQSSDRRRYNTPTANEIGANMVGDGHDGSISDRDIVLKCRDGCLQRISALHSAYTPLHYVLLFPDGRQGWSPTIPLRGFEYNADERQFNDNEDAIRGRRGSKRVSQMQYYSYMLHPRAAGEHLFLSGRLLQQYIVDAWACVE